MSGLVSLIAQYGYHIALVALIGMMVIEVVKLPLNNILKKRLPKVIENAGKFDLVAFILSFIVAAVLAVSYSLLISYTDFLSVIKGGGEELVVPLSIVQYLTNIFGTWVLQTMYYSVYKKLGIKRLLQVMLTSLAVAIRKVFDTNKDGKVRLEEAILKVQSLIENKRIDKSNVADFVEEISKEAIESFSNTIEKEQAAEGTEQGSTKSTIALQQAIEKEVTKKVKKATIKF
jgi:hypothetical protein